MPKKTRSDVYQVDLVAALFGGFMIAWLSTAEEVVFAQVGAHPSGYATVEAFTSFERPGGKRVWYKVSDVGMLNASCLSSEEIKTMFGDREHLRDCPSNIIQHPQQNGIQAGRLHELALLGSLNEPCVVEAGNNANELVEDFNSSYVLNLGLDAILSPVGMTVEQLEKTDFWADKLKIVDHHLKWSEITPFPGKSNCVAKYDAGTTVGVFAVNSSSEIIDKDHFSLVVDSTSHSVLSTIRHKDKNLFKRHRSISYNGYFHPQNPILRLRICVFLEGNSTCFHGKAALSGSDTITLNRTET